ncbi:hypothetical protein [Dactylosporangium sp. NPDC050588]|uniref:hypothetical protein n=1 Tax=Dactylosporangium sp. NPDC050588 TaxID=3157211 RepID=UPI0034063FD8
MPLPTTFAASAVAGLPTRPPGRLIAEGRRAVPALSEPLVVAFAVEVTAVVLAGAVVSSGRSAAVAAGRFLVAAALVVVGAGGIGMGWSVVGLPGGRRVDAWHVDRGWSR